MPIPPPALPRLEPWQLGFLDGSLQRPNERDRLELELQRRRYARTEAAATALVAAAFTGEAVAIYAPTMSQARLIGKRAERILEEYLRLTGDRGPAGDTELARTARKVLADAPRAVATT